MSPLVPEVTFEKVVPDGNGLGRFDGKALFVPGVLPGETARVSVSGRKKTWARGQIIEVTQPSKHRHKASEAHFMSCSPWQGVEYDYQAQLKRSMLAELYSRPELTREVARFEQAPAASGYRNKLEFSVRTDEYGELSLCFHARGSYTELIDTPAGCVLGSEAMNDAALGVLDVLRRLDVADYAETLTVRQSVHTGGVIAVMQVKRAIKRDWPLLGSLGLQGVAVVRPNGDRTTTMLWSTGSMVLRERLGGLELDYPWDSFFQVNVAMFEKTLADVMAAVPAGGRVIDLYGGAGTIGLALAAQSSQVVGVEISTASVELAAANARTNAISNYRSVASAAERMDPELLTGADTVVLDPPRAGLHPRVIDYLLQAMPTRIVYVSCNPVTQVRDCLLLQAAGYEVGEPTGYDFYPGTFHLESLVVLARS